MYHTIVFISIITAKLSHPHGKDKMCTYIVKVVIQFSIHNLSSTNTFLHRQYKTRCVHIILRNKKIPPEKSIVGN